MLALENIRLDKDEEFALKTALDDIEDEVYITGLRIKPDRRGEILILLFFQNKTA